MAVDDLYGRIALEFASLPEMTLPASRQALLYECGFADMSSEIDWTGSALVFSQQLLAQLSRGDDRNDLRLLRELAASSALGFDRRMRFDELYAELLALPPEARHSGGASGDRFVQLALEFRAATLRGIAELGSKYLPGLYFHRGEIEDHFNEFLVGDSTCFLVVSNPGRGKTNLLCNIAYRLRDERNILFLTLRPLIQSAYGLLELISSWGGYGTDWQACLADLARLPQPTLLLLDAINESATPPELLKEALHTLLREAKRARIKVVVTCRKDFWQFYRAPWWMNFIWTSPYADPEGTRAFARGQDLPLFTSEQFDDVVAAYFTAFNIDGTLGGEAAEQCRHPLMLRIFCEAHGGMAMGSITELRRYRLFREFWSRKIGQVADVSNLRQPDAVARIVLTVAGLMLQRQVTSVPRETVAAALSMGTEDLDRSTSLYSRILDEEIILEENVDEDAGVRNVVFVYDRFSEYAIALNLYTTNGWQSKSAGQIVTDVARLMRNERAFPTLRGALEFLVLRLEDKRPADLIQFAVLNAMIANRWRWTSIGTVLALQLDPALSGQAFWEFALRQLVASKSSFIRRMVADNIGPHADRSPEQVLAILNELSDDTTPSVREAAIGALRRLPVSVVLREIELLSTRVDLAPATMMRNHDLAAQLLLWPRDGTSLALRTKLEWLIGPGRSVIPEQSILRVLQAHSGNLLEDLFEQEELARAFDELRGRLEREEPGSVLAHQASIWHERATDSRDTSVALLENELAFVSKALELADQLPGKDAIRTAASMLLAHLPHPEAGLRMYNHLTEADLGELLDLSIRVQMARDLAGGDLARFRYQVLEEYGLEATPVELRGLSTIGRLVLWVHGRLPRQRLYQSQLDRLEEEIKALDLTALQDRLAVHQRPLPLAEQQAELRDLMLALVRAYKDRPASVAELLAPLIIWHQNQDSELLEGVVDQIHERDANVFWRLTEALLTRSDPSIVDLASGAIERAEEAERQKTVDLSILASLAEIVEEVAGVAADEVRMDSSWVDDLDIDSLSMVEIAVSVEDKFNVQIPDEYLKYLRTVGDAVEYIQKSSRT